MQVPDIDRGLDCLQVITSKNDEETFQKSDTLHESDGPPTEPSRTPPTTKNKGVNTEIQDGFLRLFNGSIRGVNRLVEKRINLFTSDTTFYSRFRNGLFHRVERGCRDMNHHENDQELDPITEMNPDHLNPWHNKIVVYTTSLGFIRKTKADCVLVKKMLRCLMLKSEERDLLDRQFRREFISLFPGRSPPQVVICNQHIGGARELQTLVETGRIHELTKTIEKVPFYAHACDNCAGHGYTNCYICSGSCRSKTFRVGRQLNYLKCTVCRDGLIRCVECIDTIH